MKYIFFLCVFLLNIAMLCSQENTAILCSDGIDNDNDGRIDCEDQECISIPNGGCATCVSGLSFADVVIDYQSGCTVSDLHPEGAIGVSDYWGNNDDEFEFVFLGEGGKLKLGFTNNLLSNSGDSSRDLYVFEVGSLVEPLSISLRPKNLLTKNILTTNGFLDIDSDGFYYVADLGGATSSLDIDALIPGLDAGLLLFDAVEIYDIPDIDCAGPTPGADIDAICAIFSLDCSDIQNGEAVIDECGECLLPTDPAFNMTCVDCMGVVNGEAVIDECGVCLLPPDPAFNLTCVDCLGVVNGEATFDECGECLLPTDPAFNISCVDCLGVLNGLAVIDECGECLLPDDPRFNMSCIDCFGMPNGSSVIDECGDCLEINDPLFNIGCLCCDVYFPNIFSPNQDGFNDYFRLSTCPDNHVKILNLRIFDRWGNLFYHQKDFWLNDNVVGWDGTFNGVASIIGVYTFLIDIECKGLLSRKIGTVTLVR